MSQHRIATNQAARRGLGRGGGAESRPPPQPASPASPASLALSPELGTTVKMIDDIVGAGYTLTVWRSPSGWTYAAAKGHNLDPEFAEAYADPVADVIAAVFRVLQPPTGPRKRPDTGRGRLAGQREDTHDG